MPWLFDVTCRECDQNFDVDYDKARTDNHRTKCPHCGTQYEYDVDEFGGCTLMMVLTKVNTSLM